MDATFDYSAGWIRADVDSQSEATEEEQARMEAQETELSKAWRLKRSLG
jgi:hypothetical protein